MGFKPMSLMPGDKVTNLVELHGDKGHKIKPGTKLLVIATDGEWAVLSEKSANDSEVLSMELFEARAREVKMIGEVGNIIVTRLDYDNETDKK